MVKVLNVLLDNHIGGPQIRVLSVAKELRKYGIETIMLSPKEEGDFAQRARNENFKAYQIALYGPRRSVLLNLKLLFTFPLTVFAIVKIINRENIDIVHVNGLLSFHAPIAAVLTKKKVVWHLISSLYPKTLVSLLMPFIWIMADQIVVVAKTLGEYYMGSQIKLAKTYAQIIYECVDVDKFDPIAVSKNDIDKLKKEFNINHCEKVVGCIGNINPAKGYEYFIESASLVKNEIDNVKFLIVGDISDLHKNYCYQKLKNLIASLKMEQDVIFTGKRYDIPQLLSIFDVFILPSIAEGTPLVILEAMAMEKPVVATDVGAVSEQVADGETGIIVPPRNPKAIDEAVIYLLDHPEEKVEMGRRGRERVKEMFSLERCVKEHRKLYKECVI
jgi:glycosyltransferase involved in cell wall biosynthesis